MKKLTLLLAIIITGCNSNDIPEPEQIINSSDFYFSGQVNGVSVETDSINYIGSSVVIGHQYPFIMMSLTSKDVGSYKNYNGFNGCIQMLTDSGSVISWCNTSNPNDTIGCLDIETSTDSLISGSIDYYITTSNYPVEMGFKDTTVNVSGSFNGIRL